MLPCVIVKTPPVTVISGLLISRGFKFVAHLQANPFSRFDRNLYVGNNAIATHFGRRGNTHTVVVIAYPDSEALSNQNIQTFTDRYGRFLCRTFSITKLDQILEGLLNNSVDRRLFVRPPIEALFLPDAGTVPQEVYEQELATLDKIRKHWLYRKV